MAGIHGVRISELLELRSVWHLGKRCGNGVSVCVFEFIVHLITLYIFLITMAYDIQNEWQIVTFSTTAEAFTPHHQGLHQSSLVLVA